ncbi:hypothetical protein H4R35_005717, partial [Dimargaris xerosporica]
MTDHAGPQGLDDLLAYVTTEIARDGDCGSSWARIQTFVQSFQEQHLVVPSTDAAAESPRSSSHSPRLHCLLWQWLIHLPGLQFMAVECAAPGDDTAHQPSLSPATKRRRTNPPSHALVPHHRMQLPSGWTMQNLPHNDEMGHPTAPAFLLYTTGEVTQGFDQPWLALPTVSWDQLPRAFAARYQGCLHVDDACPQLVGSHYYLYVVASQDRIFEHLFLGLDGAQTLLTTNSNPLLQFIARRRTKGFPLVDLSQDLGIDPRSLFSFIKHLIEFRLITRVPYVTRKSYTNLCHYTPYSPIGPASDTSAVVDGHLHQMATTRSNQPGTLFTADMPVIEPNLNDTSGPSSLYYDTIRKVISDRLAAAPNHVLLSNDLRCAVFSTTMKHRQAVYFNRVIRQMANTGYVERIKVPLDMVQSSSSAALDAAQLEVLPLVPSPTKLRSSPPVPSPVTSFQPTAKVNAGPSPVRRNPRRACAEAKADTTSIRKAMALDDDSDSEDEFQAMTADEVESDDAAMEDGMHASDVPANLTPRKTHRLVQCIRLLKPYVAAHRSLGRAQPSSLSADENASRVDILGSQLATPAVIYGQWPTQPRNSPADHPTYRVALSYYLFNPGYPVPLPVAPSLPNPTPWPEGTLSYGRHGQGVPAFQTLETMLYQAIVASGDAGTPIGPLRTQFWTVAYKALNKLIDGWVMPKHFKSYRPKPALQITLSGCTEEVHELQPTLQITGTFESFGRMRRKRFQVVRIKASDRALMKQWQALTCPPLPEPHWLPPMPPTSCASLPELTPPAGEAPVTPHKRMAVTSLPATPQSKRARSEVPMESTAMSTPGSQGVTANQRRQILLRIIEEQEIVQFNRAMISGLFLPCFEEEYGAISTTFDIKTLRRDCESLERAGSVQLVHSMLPLPVGSNAAVVLLVHPKVALDDPRIHTFVTNLNEQRIFHKGTVRKAPTASIHVQRLSPEQRPGTQVGAPGPEEAVRTVMADPKALEEAWMVLAQDLGWVRPKYRRAHLLYEWLATYVRDPAHVDHEYLYPWGVFRMSLLFRAMPLTLFLKLINQRQLRACNLPVVYNAMVSGDYAALQPSESLDPYAWDDSSLQFLQQDVSPRERNRYRIGVYLLQHQSSSIPLADIPPVIHAELFRSTSHIADRFAKLLDIIQALYLVQPVYGDPSEVQQPAMWTQVLSQPTNDQGAVTPAATTVFQLTTSVPMKHHGAPTVDKPVMGLFEVGTPNEVAGYWRQLEISSDPSGMGVDIPGPAATRAKASLDQTPPVVLNSSGVDPLAFITVRAMWAIPLHFTRSQRRALDQCIDKHTGDTPLVNSVQCTRLAEELGVPESSVVRYYRRVERARELRRLRKQRQDLSTTPSRMRLHQYVEARSRKDSLAARRLRHKVVLAEGIPKSRRGRKSIASLQSTLQQRIERTHETDLLPKQQKAAWYRPFRNDVDDTEEVLPTTDLYSTPSSSHGSRLTQSRIRIAWDQFSDNRLLVYYAVMRLISQLPNRRFLWLPAIAYLPAMSRRFCDFYCEHHPTVPKRIMEYYVATQTSGIPRAKLDALAAQVLQTAVYSFEGRNRNTNRIRWRFKRLMSDPSIHDYAQRLGHLWQRLYDFGVEAGDILRFEESARYHKQDIATRQDEITPHWVAFWLHYFQTSHSPTTVAFRQSHLDVAVNAAIDASDPAPPHDFQLLLRWMLHSDRLELATSIPYVHDDTWYIDFDPYLSYWEQFQSGALADRLQHHGLALTPMPAPMTLVTGAMLTPVDLPVVGPSDIPCWTLPSSPGLIQSQFTVAPMLLDRYHQACSNESVTLSIASRPTDGLVQDGVAPKQYYYEEGVQAATSLIRCNQLLCQQP